MPHCRVFFFFIREKVGSTEKERKKIKKILLGFQLATFFMIEKYYTGCPVTELVMKAALEDVRD